MKPEDFRLICTYDEGGWCVRPEKKPLSGIMVHVDKLEDAPKKLAKLFEAMFTIVLKKGMCTKHDYTLVEK